MRRRRNRNQDETNSLGIVFTKLGQFTLAAVLVLFVAEWAAGFAMGKIRHSRSAATPSLTDAEISRVYGSDDPSVYRTVLADAARLGEAVYAPLVEYRLPAFSSRTLNVNAEGWRSNGVAQSLDNPGPKVFVFGGSTTFGTGVADGETLPAQLGEVLKAAGKDVQVFNFGAPSYYSTQERIALERLLTAGIKPDVAVFVDGLGDFQSCTLPDRTAWSDRIAQATGAAARLPLTSELAARSNLLAFGRWLIGEEPAEAPHRTALCSSDAEVDRAIRRLDSNRRMIAGMADRLGFKAVFVQQPVPTYVYDNSKRSVPVNTELLANYLNSAKGYPRMAEMRSAGQLLADHTLWLTEIEPAQGDAYVDTIHYSPRFNRALAEAIGRHVLDSALLP